MSKMGVVVGRSGLYDESSDKAKPPTKTNKYINKITYTKIHRIHRGEEQKWQA